MKKILALLLAVMLVFGMTACGGGDKDDPTTTTIRIMNFDGGVGHDWLHEAAERFEELNKDKSYGENKTGVDVKITDDMSVNLSAMSSSQYNIYFAERVTNFLTYVNQGDLYDVTDWVKEVNTDGKTIESKFIDDFTMRLQGADGRYYALPHYEWYSGGSFDITMFDEYGFYLAAPEETEVITWYCDFGKANFIANADAKKACGNDGVYGTSDDGLPTTLQDLLVLCDYIKAKNVTPFLVSGKYIRYTSHFGNGLWASLAGMERMRVNYDLEGEIDQVIDFNAGELFTGYDEAGNPVPYAGIRKPTTQKLTINSGNWGKIYDDVNRYYMAAFFDIAYNENWIDIGTEEDTHVDAMRKFCTNSSYNPTRYGMIMEGSYWYTEAKMNGLTEDATNEVQFLSMPTALYSEDAVTEGNGRNSVLVENAAGLCLVCSNVEREADVLAAVKDFVKFLYTDSELEAFTASSGCGRALNYEVSKTVYDAMPAYQKGIWDVRNGGKNVLYPGTTNSFAKDKIYDLALSDFSEVVKVKYGNEDKDCYFRALRELSGQGYAVNAETLFENTKK